MNELQDLITRMLEERLSPRDAKKLEERLQNDPEARHHYVQQCQLHAQLKLNPDGKQSLRAAAPIELDPNPNEDPAVSAQSQSFLSKFGSQLAVMAASVAISAAGILVVLRFSEPQVPSTSVGVEENDSPETRYKNAHFSSTGSLKRPPTNFAALSSDTSEEMDSVSFNRDIRPILSENCYHCHGPDASTREADLRLDREDSAYAPHGEFAAPIIRGDPKNSPLYQRISSPLKSEVMPPPDSGKSLSADEIDLIKAWIEQGAEWEPHWAFVRPEKKDPPPSKWGEGPIDAFIAEKHRELGLTPNPPADNAALARRASLDITGLPPSPEQVEALVSDESPDAFERYVDTLLADPAYGEHRARYWLDAARYADTHGLHLDNYREIWPYRDWVINAFNDNKPFDEFTIEQVAGDLLTSPQIDELIATGFNRCNPTTSEGGAIDEEYKAIYAKDRVETTSTVFLGLTMGCASCHDHKFDPLSQQDFYRFAAFFNNVDGPIMDGNRRDTKPNVVLPDARYAPVWAKTRPKHEGLLEAFEKAKENRESHFEEWHESGGANHGFPNLADTFELQLASKEKPEKKSDDPEAEDGDDEPDPEPAKSSAPPADLVFEHGKSIPLPKPFIDASSPFSLYIELNPPKLEQGDEQLILSQFDGDAGWRLFLLSGDKRIPDRYRLRFELISSLRNNDLISVTTKSLRYTAIRLGRTNKLLITYDGSKRASGIRLGSPERLVYDGAFVIDELQGDAVANAPLSICPLTEPKKAPVIGRIAFHPQDIPLYALSASVGTERARELLEKSPEKRSERDIRNLKSYYFSVVDPVTREIQKELASSAIEYDFIYDISTVSLVMKEKDGPAFAHILERGNYDQKKEKVFPEIPEALGSLPENASPDRLSLAQWLVSDVNPLTARVTVNRIWQNIFGHGLVKTSEDFGIMGENPTHPELLDWLAVDFRENGWDVKALIKQIITSATYRQSSHFTKDEYAIDPENRYLARGPRFRLDAETIRDQALAVSGNLIDEIGGPSVKPYQPKGIWEAVAYSGSNTRFFHPDEGDALYRRSLYTFWKRTAPPPNMRLFDAPSRENCSVRRERTNTPLQALTLMNDPQYVEAARLLAQRALRANAKSAAERIDAMYRFAFGADIAENHRQVLLRSYRRFEDDFRSRPENAQELLNIGHASSSSSVDPVQLASLTLVASQIMNLDSFINKY